MRAGCSCGRRVFFGTYSSADDIARVWGVGGGGGALLGVRHGVGDLLSLPPSRPRLLSSNPSPSTIALPFTLSHTLPFSLRPARTLLQPFTPSCQWLHQTPSCLPRTASAAAAQPTPTRPPLTTASLSSSSTVVHVPHTTVQRTVHLAQYDRAHRVL